jgi:hypothetical protein
VCTPLLTSLWALRAARPPPPPQIFNVFAQRLSLSVDELRFLFDGCALEAAEHAHTHGRRMNGTRRSAAAAAVEEAFARGARRCRRRRAALRRCAVCAHAARRGNARAHAHTRSFVLR